MTMRWVRCLFWLPAVPVALVLLYAATAWIAIHHSMGWQGRINDIDEFRFHNNTYERKVADGTASVFDKRRFNHDEYLWLSVWVRHGQISQCRTFSLWPFRVMGWPGFIHPPGT